MPSLWSSKGKILRNWQKSLSKKLANNCDLNSLLFQNSMWRYFVYSMTLITLCVTVWTVGTSNTEVITVTFTSNNDMIKAVYKCAYENADGSVDLVFNIPRGGEELVKLNAVNKNSSSWLSAHNKLPVNNSVNTSSTVNDPRPLVRSSYPISLDAAYLINSVHLCPVGQQVDYIIVVHSATAYFVRRRAIRETYGSARLFGQLTHRVVFLLGQTHDPVTTKLIQEEAMLHKDIVQGRFLDSYHNLTHKGVLGYRWVSEHCPQAKIVIKIDDDVFINPFKLIREILPLYQNTSRHIGCHVRRSGTSVIVRGKGKWMVHEDEFRGQKYYPFDYCNGYFVIITSDLIRPMLNAARINPFFWIDDVYLFGILPATVGGTKFMDLRMILSLRFDDAKKCFEKNGASCKLLAVSQWRPEESENLWYLVLSNLTETVKKELHVFGKS